MYQLYKWLCILFILVLTSGCLNNNENIENQSFEVDSLQEELRIVEVELQTTKEINEELNRELESVETENLTLKNDLLTYRQETIEINSHFEKEKEIRRALDIRTLEILHAMSIENHNILEQHISSDVEIIEENATLIFHSEGMERSFHYIKNIPALNKYLYDFNLNVAQDEFTLLYAFKEEVNGEDGFHYEGILEFIYEEDSGEWFNTSIRYVTN